MFFFTLLKRLTASPQKTLCCLLILLLASGISLSVWSAFHFLQSTGTLPARNITITVQPGATISSLAPILEREGCISNARFFRWLALYKNRGNALKAGRFMVNTGWSPSQVLKHLTEGQPYMERVTIPEGLTWWNTAELLEKAGLVRFEDFRDVIHDPEFLRHWGISGKNAEGFLFPDTYLFLQSSERNRASARTIASRMIDTFWKKIGMMRQDSRPLSRSRVQEIMPVLILASIVEKETGCAEERSKVAGVYANRQKLGMLLQADPTTIYGLGQQFHGRLRRSHLNDDKNPYNTYRQKGLPPGPICSPGMKSLKAAFNPEKHDYLYFVSRNDGTHFFSRTLKEHNNAVNKYQR
ncbi:MAG: endolytic transglycosylase MltG [Desulfovibrionaceae bacterium]|nr:endolytic transglycosylase MltG [Desulfovibrionaceae bacterium]